jgi:hypothetical protein
VLLESSLNAAEYADIQVSAARRPILADTFIADGHVYAGAGANVLKVAVAECARHSTCTTCIQSGDPYCGWCTLQNE